MEVVEVAPGVHHARAKHVSWVLVTEGEAVTLVDTGYPGDRAAVLESLRHIGRSPTDVESVVLTHGHPDHIGSAEHLRTSYGIPVWAHELEAANARGERVEQVSELRLLSMLWRPAVFAWLGDVIRLKAARVERLGDLELFVEQQLDVPGAPAVVHTPGHTTGHCSLHLPERGVLLAGDALMTAHALVRVPGPQLLPDFFNTDTARARTSLERLRGLAADVVVPGHGPAFNGSPADAVEQALRRSAPGS
jgi:glyoxylase-like metal-dependent hydrolase (beta-lactamase superfamily II)